MDNNQRHKNRNFFNIMIIINIVIIVIIIVSSVYLYIHINSGNSYSKETYAKVNNVYMTYDNEDKDIQVRIGKKKLIIFNNGKIKEIIFNNFEVSVYDEYTLIYISGDNDEVSISVDNDKDSISDIVINNQSLIE
ncbi:hypothetical protein FPHOBKDP_00132 [Listeria phage LPJP1]|nr:hypothetical protein FPHOBKDP_00132 [Listeria phage LPJP1]